MMFRVTDDLRIAQLRPLIPPAILMEELPVSEGVSTVIAEARDKDYENHASLKDIGIVLLINAGAKGSSPVTEDVRVRRAFAMAIDHERLRQVSGEELVLPTGIMPPGMPGYAPEPRLLPFDQDAARELLAQAGYGPGQGRVLRVVHTTSNESEVARRIYEEIARQVAEVGFQMTTEYQGWLDFNRRLRARELQCFSLTWVADIPDPDSFLYPLFHTGGSANFTFYDQPAVNDLLRQGRNTRSTLQRWDLYREAERRILGAVRRTMSFS